MIHWGGGVLPDIRLFLPFLKDHVMRIILCLKDHVAMILYDKKILFSLKICLNMPMGPKMWWIRKENMQKGNFIIWQLCEKEITVITQCPSFKFLILRTLWNGKVQILPCMAVRSSNGQWISFIVFETLFLGGGHLLVAKKCELN